MFSLLLIVGCSSSGGAGDHRDSRGADIPAKAEWTVIPFTEGLSIQWQNLGNFSHTDILEHFRFSLIGGNLSMLLTADVAGFVDGSYRLTGLKDGVAYRFGEVVELEYRSNVSRSRPIAWSWRVNRVDNGGDGIMVGANHDRDGRANGMDADDDNDGVNNTYLGGIVRDLCRFGKLNWVSNKDNDYDGDGCRDEGEMNGGYGEDMDDDNDQVMDMMDACPVGKRNWRNDGTNDMDGDGCHNNEDPDADNDGLLNKYEVAGCELAVDCDNDTILDIDEEADCAAKPDCDDDGVGDSDEMPGCELKPDCDNDGQQDGVDIDTDGDGLIEIRTAEELNAVRFVLNGTGFKADAEATIDQTGCGNGTDIGGCFGYELMRDISLADYIAETNVTHGWQPIAHDVDSMTHGCNGGVFTAVFDGNGFEISGLFINRSRQDCVGLFGQANGRIANLGLVADRIIGDDEVGVLVGLGDDVSISHSYGVSREVRGDDAVGGLVGDGSYARILGSYAVSGLVHGGDEYVGGLVGDGDDAVLIKSYAMSGSVSGDDNIGGLIGRGDGAEIIQSYAVSGEVSGGDDNIGGLVGCGEEVEIMHSYAVTGSVNGDSYVGGLVGSGEEAKVFQSYAVSDVVYAGTRLGGLVGYGEDASIVQSYGVSGVVRGNSSVGGLVGVGDDAEVMHSYAVSGEVSGGSRVGGLIGDSGTAITSYWDNQTSGINDDDADGSQPQDSTALRSPTDYATIYETWDDGMMVDSINDNDAIWCDEDQSGVIETDEMRNAGHPNGDNRVWDFGGISDYPALRCLPDSLADQRAWWFLNTTTHKPQLNRTHLDARLRLERERLLP